VTEVEVRREAGGDVSVRIAAVFVIAGELGVDERVEDLRCRGGAATNRTNVGR